MTLSEYLATEKITYAAFAERIGAGHARTVERYAKGQRTPDGDMLRTIFDKSDGAVTPNDFFGVRPEQPAGISIPEAEAA
jgi:transcriptional regulator with XRE-family HTH domain